MIICWMTTRCPFCNTIYVHQHHFGDGECQNILCQCKNQFIMKLNVDKNCSVCESKLECLSKPFASFTWAWDDKSQKVVAGNVPISYLR